MNPLRDRQFFWSFCVFFLILFGIWMGIISWEIGRLQSADMLVAKRANMLVGKSSAMDLTLIFLAEESGDYALTILAVVMAIAVIRRALVYRANPGVLFSHALYLGLALLVTYGIVETMNRSVSRPSPARVMTEYRDPGASYGIEYDANLKSLFPSRRVALTSVIFFLLWFRFGRRALMLLSPPLLVGGVHVAVGQSWPSEALAGTILGWMIASSFYFLGLNRLHVRVESLFERAYEEGVVRRTFRTIGRWAKTRNRDTRIGYWDREGNARRGAAPMPTDLLALMNREWPAAEVELIGSGHKQKLFPVLRDGRPYALKVSRLNADRLKALERAIALVESCVKKKAIRTPSVLPSHSGKLFVPWNKRHVYLMEWVQGVTADVSNPDQCARVLRMLAAFHANAGAPPESAVLRAHDVLRGELQQIQTDLTRCRRAARSLNRWLIPESAEAASYSILLEDLHRAESLVHLAMLYQGAEKNSRNACYIHGDAHPMNYLFDEQEDPWLLDFDAIRPGFAFEDLEPPLDKCLRRHGWDPQLFEDLVAEYLAVRRIGNWELLVLLARLISPRHLAQALSGHPLGRLLPQRTNWLRLLKGNVEYSMMRGAREAFLASVIQRFQAPSFSDCSVRPPQSPEPEKRSSAETR